MREIYRILIQYDDDQKQTASVDISYGRGKRKLIKGMKICELTNGWVLHEKEEDAAPESFWGCIAGLLKRLFDIS